ncbi:MAG: bifunctional DNA primase/polymerase [Solirubrobacteraceae bacterium]
MIGEIRQMTARGWRLLAIRPGGKQPLTAHGVNDATADPDVVAGWLARWPDMNLGVATGAPGPQVLDVDDLGAVPAALARAVDGAPRVATPRGGHVYLAGTDAPTVKLAYGELRGRGSYVVCPPSVHPTGRQYVWLHEPRGALPTIPKLLAGAGRRAGCGVHEAPVERVPHGHRHPYLLDFGVRLARAGVTDERRLAVHLEVEFGLACEPDPPPAPGYFDELAHWAARSLIAGRERRRHAL